MLFLEILALFMGAMYLWMGARIVFYGQVGLINNYFADQKAGNVDEAYARRYGLISLCCGAPCAAAGLFGLLSGDKLLSAVLLLACIIGSLGLFKINRLRSVRG
ncbi:MAG: hypothetical protein PHI98_12075 [Eubacteriales bacterium]|nr:hypothetical protein [Eubacteriales bacterium]